MSEEKQPVDGLLFGGRSRSYGSLVRSNLSPVRRRVIQHHIQPGETLQGLALKYGVTMEQIQRANRLYTNDSIFLKKSLSIPVLSDVEGHTRDEGGHKGEGEDSGEVAGRTCPYNGLKASPSYQENAPELTARDFLTRLDGFISESKQAAARGWKNAEKRVTDLEAVCSSRTNERQSPVGRRHQALHVTVPLTTTKLTMKLKKQEDEIFEL
ncbi:lysM and putative peptidoglycan-binding domain-containing protein 1 [Dunckerocampus dactyliophorus]|uniref:lysM and putative peptidoglycan-binding domain-containing protein 1 n=1 Tax=Dunckerocampus dactyliophorus TaxID=161453 RepID=UPI00240544E0|nr:lysM and putative peptidoglycan-binding domain-containing protein 1 [Dunckerocampus dactyliophorus]XP_054636688.1 lysM and putative peptidoglycan-binding domain-containing protein 1 [Dunckerocampus dactyliophorus]